MADNDWEKVLFAHDCVTCHMCGEPWCEQCETHYTDCDCPGPSEDEVYEYREVCGKLYARKKIVDSPVNKD